LPCSWYTPGVSPGFKNSAASLTGDGTFESEPGWAPDFYKTVYEGYERAQSFPDEQALARYRTLLLRKTREQVEFIQRHVGQRPLRVIEYCCGNGRLLVSLAKSGLLEEGVGIEISGSRASFAQRWIEDSGVRNICIEKEDVLAFGDVVPAGFDLAVCITGAFGYFKPIANDAPAALLGKMRAALKPDGRILLELYQLPRERQALLALSGNRLRTWKLLPQEDPFAYYLDEFQFWPDRQTLRHEKIFIGRDGSIDAGRYEVLAYYDLNELRRLLESQGFRDVVAFSTFAEESYLEGTSAALVVLARAA
jgi:SAM-dependent methyltransferase